ncbi:YybH family protein [Epibacterium ulvae]|uniref:YybH family protein n=1 Tax=Epibacterium ulvae TaxID=1156985 RepID=UPI0024906382|nr:DUF4440 domain-containing protein [Epibacterium ulvae]
MKHACAWLIALAFSTTQTLAEDHKIMTQDQKDVIGSIETMTHYFQAGDIARVMESYEEKATIVFEPDTPQPDTGEQVRLFTELSAINPTFDYVAGHEVVVNGDIAMHIAPWSMTGHTPDGQEIKQSGLSVAVLRKQSDGSWKMVIDNPHSGRLLNQ